MTDEAPGPEPITDIIQHQARWARYNGLAVEPSNLAFADPSGGLFVNALSPETIRELSEGAGGELDRIHRLRSSTCLALNVFEPWRTNPAPLGRIFGAPVQSLRFEAKQPTGLGGVSPHLDVLLTGSEHTIGIECKLLEMYSPTENKFADSYFTTDGLWDGLDHCRELAMAIASDTEQFRWLHAAQLLKHTLGLRKNQSGEFRLVLVWYRLDGPEADAIESEIGRFTRAISDDIDFTAMTYQELVSRMTGLHEPMPGHLDYLRGRYRLDGGWQRRLPLLEMSSHPPINHRTALASTIDAVEVDELAKAYLRSVAAAPQRPLRGKSYLVGHDGAGDASSPDREKVVAKALFNLGEPLRIGEDSVTLIDYEVPLRAERADGGIGEIDLLGIDETSRPWIVELKVEPNKETPLKALLQGLRYAAMVDANRRALAREISERHGIEHIAWPAVLAVAADHSYWDRLTETAKAGAWLESLVRLSRAVESTLGSRVVYLDLGVIEVEIIDQRAQLASPLRIERIV